MTDEYRQEKIPRVGHIHLKVSDLERSVDFYRTHLEMRVTEEIEGRYAFLSFGAAHHDLALQAVGKEAPRPQSEAIGMFHVAFELADRTIFARFYRRLRDHRIPLLATDYGISWAIYFTDPDGNGIELYLDRRRQPDGREQWYGMTNRLTAEEILGE